jgi:DNA-directed RNA polymerase subunit RPC12/RpoP
MHFSSMAHVLGLVGVTPVRAFLPAFLTALAIRIGGIPYLTDAASADAAVAPSWFTHHYTLIVLGLLSLLEIIATKSPEARQLLSTIDEYYKPALAAFTTFGVISASDASAVEALHGGTAAASLLPIAAISFGGVGLSFIFSTLTAAGTYFVCTVRSALLLLLDDIDADDSMGMQSLLSWAGDAWVAILVVLLVLVPVLILSLVALALFGLWLLRVYIDRKAEAAKVDCPDCGARVFPFATVCHSCRAAIRNVSSIGFLGQARPEAAADMTAHRLKLISLKKCPQCGSRLKRKTMHQTCEVCAHALAVGDRLPDSYLKMVQARLPQVLLICGLLGAVPVVGMIPSIIYYRIVLVSPFRAYITLGSSFVSRWLLRIVGVLLIACFSWVPVLSAFLAPALAYLSYAIYRSAFLRQWFGETTSQARSVNDPLMKSGVSSFEVSGAGPVVACAVAASAERHEAAGAKAEAPRMVTGMPKRDAHEAAKKKLEDARRPTDACADGRQRVVCQSCGLKLRAPGSMAGLKAKCPKCGAVVFVPPLAPLPAAPPSPKPRIRPAEPIETQTIPVPGGVFTAELVEPEPPSDKARVATRPRSDARKGSEPAVPTISIADEIRNLKVLLDDGLLTAEEFTQKKRQLLGL